MHNLPTVPSQRLLVPALLLGTIATLCLIVTSLDYYSAIKEVALFRTHVNE